MEKEKPPIPFRMTLLIVGYFQRTINEAEQGELDDWICASKDNQRAFEDCVEMSLRPHIKNELDIENELLRKEQEDYENYLPYIVDTIIKRLKGTITTEEQQDLDDWIEMSDANEELFRSIPQTPDMEVVFRWILKRLWENRHRPECN